MTRDMCMISVNDISQNTFMLDACPCLKASIQFLLFKILHDDIFNCFPTRDPVQVNTLDQLGLVVYHEGSDGGQLDWVEMQTSDGALVRCNLGTNIFSSASNIFFLNITELVKQRLHVCSSLIFLQVNGWTTTRL